MDGQPAGHLAGLPSEGKITMTDASPQLRSGRLYEKLASALRAAIAAGTYQPGDRLPAERELAATFKVSRPTIREAVIALELDGLVEVKVGSGVYVLPPPAAGVSTTPVVPDIGAFELTEARILIEGEAAALAAEHISDPELAELEALLEAMALANNGGDGDPEAVDMRFHLLIAEATRNGALAAAVEQLWSIRNRSPQCIRTFNKSRDKGNRPVLAEHEAIVSALRARDPGRARQAMRAHLGRVLDYLLDATEVETIEETKKQLQATRARFSRRARL